jgi:oligoribonuclease NrnB/cAMP/cGMP phosphodiesterase (DHH superfamily)
VAIAKAASFVSRSLLLGKIIDESEIDLPMAYTSDGKLSVRRKHGLPEKDLQIDCSKVAAAFREGGGHPGAAGGFLKTNI